MRKKQTDIADLISNDRTAEARVFLSELDKTDRMADRLAGGIEVNCPHGEDPPTVKDIISELVDSLGGKSGDTVEDCIAEKLEPLGTMLRAICAHLKIETEE